MKRRRALVLLLILLLLCGGGTIVLVCRRAPEALLLKRATRVAAAKDWSDGWIWIDDHRLLHGRVGTHYGPDNYDQSFSKFDLRTHQETMLTGLTRLAKASSWEVVPIIAPDGRHLCWVGKDITVTTLYGEQPFHLATKEKESLIWTAWTGDSSHLVVYTRNSDRTKGDLRTIYDIRSRRLIHRDEVESDTWIGVLSNDGRELKIPWNYNSSGTSDTVEIEETALDDGLLQGTHPFPKKHGDIRIDATLNERTPTRKHQVHLPFPSPEKTAYFSPKGDRVAWLLIDPIGVPPPFLAWLQKLIPAFHQPQKPKAGIWVSRLDGSEMREIGYLPITLNRPGGLLSTSDDLPDAIEWSPDGTRLSFHYKQSLYIVPVD